jgi:hypothetical protein
MKIQKLPNGEIQITFRPEEVVNYQTVLPLEQIEQVELVKTFEHCMFRVHKNTRLFLFELRDHYGIGKEIKRTDEKVNELRFKYRITDVAQAFKYQIINGLISVKRANENKDSTSKILTFKFNY